MIKTLTILLWIVSFIAVLGNAWLSIYAFATGDTHSMIWHSILTAFCIFVAYALIKADIKALE